ncbi:sialate O-acetylesterase [Enterococcus sp. CSURQ0835]|uniref:sialate O-acetylesterase n=1 Tax=Enterococcus sp. CSURQ0835 TaxID=2681394 RepID=UPI001357D5DE|nr:sialate O-acetylesterase [Enterococcus sp. CSURQ0835]
MKSVLLVGQSNMAGRGFLHEVAPIYNEKIKMLRNGRWQMMAEPINYDREVAGVGLAASFAQRFSEAEPELEIGLIPCAEGGSSIAEWQPGEVLLEHALQEAEFAQTDSELVAILWHQGENDSYGGRYQNYEEQLNAVFTAFQTKFPGVPILVGELGHYLGQSGFGQSAVEYAQINQKILAVTEKLTDCYWVTAQELMPNPDGIHLNAVSQRRFGLRYYEAFAKRQSVTQPVVGELDWLKRSRPETSAVRNYLLSKEFVLGRIDFATFMKKFAVK